MSDYLCVLCGGPQPDLAINHVPFCPKCTKAYMPGEYELKCLLQEGLLTEREHEALLGVWRNEQASMLLLWNGRQAHKSKTIALLWEMDESPPSTLAGAISVTELGFELVHLFRNQNLKTVTGYQYGRVLRSKVMTPAEATRELVRRRQELDSAAA